MILYVDEFQEEIVSEQFEVSQGLYNQQMHVNVQRNLREGVWVSKSGSGGEIQMCENLPSDGVILIMSGSDSQANESEIQERVRENVSEVRVNEHNSHLNESEAQERESESEVRVNEHDIQASEVTMTESKIHERVLEKLGATKVQVSTKVTL